MRHRVCQLTIMGEILPANDIAADEYLSEFAYLIASENYSPQQVYNTDKKGLNFEAHPIKSIASKEELAAPGFKMDKQRLTKMVFQKALLMIDNAPLHPSDTVLVNGDVNEIFLSPNVTSIIEQMDQGVLQNIKLHNRKIFLRALIEREEPSVKEK
ncbi:hypothetical protein PR048_019673 [Dryococelus australis]|uniref:DDE-1 domain-containing protein n=1 Tax=Dryococelus australis TaxID=614101 RepID=A0ABQ9H468_9NEOP|nr:hypothetical protein PR048_019673 [Dryococelus australis]